MRINRANIVLFSCASLLLGFQPCMAQLQTSAPSFLAGLSYAIEEIIKLSQAEISEQVIINYIESSGTLYDLKPQDVIRLRDEGVTDGVINAMIDQRRKFQTNAVPPVANAPATPAPPAVQYTVNVCPRFCGVCRGPLVTCREPISTLHIIPYTSTQRTYRTYQNWGPYHYYGSYGSWRRPFHGPRLYRCGHWHGCSHWD